MESSSACSLESMRLPTSMRPMVMTRVLISIETLAVISGWLPARAMGLVIEWASLHKDELRKNWEKVYNHQKPDKIEPLK